jgi:magnesium-transporting ATPase (P-type)
MGGRFGYSNSCSSCFRFLQFIIGVTAGNDYSKDLKFKKLMLLQTDKKCRVIRGGSRYELSSWELLVGDVVELVVGDEIAADGLYISGNGLVIDESPLTGETMPVKKSSSACFLFSGCQVSEGTALMMVLAVGVNSTGGKIQELLNESQDNLTPLQAKLKDVALLIGNVGVSAGFITFAALLIRWIVSWAKNSDESLGHKCSTGSVLSGGGDAIMRVLSLVNSFVVAITGFYFYFYISGCCCGTGRSTACGYTCSISFYV